MTKLRGGFQSSVLFSCVMFNGLSILYIAVALFYLKYIVPK